MMCGDVSCQSCLILWSSVSLSFCDVSVECVCMPGVSRCTVIVVMCAVSVSRSCVSVYCICMCLSVCQILCQCRTVFRMCLSV